MAKPKPPRPTPGKKKDANPPEDTNNEPPQAEVEEHAEQQQDAEKSEDLPILPKPQDVADKTRGLGSTSAAVAAGNKHSQLSLLLGKQVLKAPLGGGSSPEVSVVGEGGKRERDEGFVAPGEPKPPGKKPKKVSALNQEAVRAIVREELGSFKLGIQEAVALAIEEASNEHYRRAIREEVRAIMGCGPSETLQEALTGLYTEALRTALAEGAQKLGRHGFPDLPRTDPFVTAKWSALEATLDNLEKLVKSKADEDTLRAAKNAIMDVKSATDNLKVGGTSNKQKLDQIRSLLASLPPSQLQPFAQQPNFSSPWRQFQGNNQGAPSANHPTPPVRHDLRPTSAGPSNPGSLNQASNAARPAAQAPNPSRRAHDNDYPKEQLVAIRSSNVSRSLPSHSQGLQALLRKAEYPDNAISAADCYIPLKPLAKPGSPDVILTFKVCFPNAAVRTGFLELANNDRVARLLNALDVTIEPWKDKSDIMLERNMRYSTNIARNAENELAAQFNSTVASAFSGSK
eukprot:TRINITY_DN16049_c0_g1_i1.p1 TRINITY_DN16049_c0_g1~~TRINITY_DN16049_c0_g1_i1.p1  ORF type:complete len:515 (+),score=88.44 TRINITY_DN16049_c0_g1_i1:695-2239(+)